MSLLCPEKTWGLVVAPLAGGIHKVHISNCLKLTAAVVEIHPVLDLQWRIIGGGEVNDVPVGSYRGHCVH
jgi:hypothetical protein